MKDLVYLYKPFQLIIICVLQECISEKNLQSVNYLSKSFKEIQVLYLTSKCMSIGTRCICGEILCNINPHEKIDILLK